MTADYALKTEDLNLYYGTFHALKDVNFYVFQKSITSLIGPSGCGKSTLLRCFNRMNDLIEEVKIEGKILWKGRTSERGRHHRAAEKGGHGLSAAEPLSLLPSMKTSSTASRSTAWEAGGAIRRSSSGASRRSASGMS